MPASVCFTDMKKTLERATKNILKPEDVEALLKEVRMRAESRLRKRSEPIAEAYNKTVDEIIAEREAKLKKNRLQTYINKPIIKAGIDQIRGGKKFLDRAMPGFFTGYESNVFKSRDSVARSIVNAQTDVISNFLANLYKTKTYEVFNNRQNSTELARALWGDENVASNIKGTANVIKDVQKYMRNLLNELGSTPSESENYVAKTVHNRRKMLSATGSGIKDTALRARLFVKHAGNYDLADNEFREMSYQRWRKTITPLTDEKTLDNVEDTEEAIDKFYRGFYRSTTTGLRKFPVSETGHPYITNINSNIARSLEAERVWFAKDGQSWGKYNEEYGFGATQGAIYSQLFQVGHQIGLMRKLGASPKIGGEYILRTLKQEFADDKRFPRALKKAKRALEAVTSNPMYEFDGMLGKIEKALNYMAYAKLGSITISSIPDVNSMASALRPLGVSYLETNAELLKQLAKGMPKGELRQLGLDLGTYAEGVMGKIYSRFGAVGEDGVFSKLLKLQDKLSLINYYDNIGRFTMGTMLSNRFSRLLSKSFNSLPEITKNNFLRYGIDEKVWDLLQNPKKDFVTIQGRKFVTPSMARDISDEDIINKWFGGKIGRSRELKLARTRTEIERRLQNFFIDGAAYGKIFPDAGDRAILMGPLGNDTLPGKLWKMVTTFKSFSIAQTRRTLGRFLYGQGAQNLYEATIGGKGDYAGLIKYMLGSIPYGYLSMAGHLLARGMAPPSLTDPKTWTESMIRGGSFAIYGDLLFDNFNRNHQISKSVVGPQLNTAANVVNLLGKMAFGKPKSAENAAINFIQYNFPVINTFYFKKAVDNLIFERLHEWVDPMYKVKQQRLAKREGLTPLF